MQVTHAPEVLAELRKNQEAYDAVKGEMEAEHWGRVVLLHDGAIIAIYNDESDAYDIGCEKFGLGRFSLHRVGQRSIDLGFRSLSLRSGF